MTETPPDQEILSRLHEEIGRESERISDLQSRIRVLDVEVAGWKMPPPPDVSGGRSDTESGKALGAFFIALIVTAFVGKIVALALRQ